MQLQKRFTDQQLEDIVEEATLEAHAVMEACMERVLDLEGWDRDTLKMPEGLRRKREESIARDD